MSSYSVGPSMLQCKKCCSHLSEAVWHNRRDSEGLPLRRLLCYNCGEIDPQTLEPYRGKIKNNLQIMPNA